MAVYGVHPLPYPAGPPLEPALTLKTQVTLVRELPAGHGISYGRTYVTAAPTRVATLAIGYGDGYPRHVSGNGASVIIRGIPCPLLGRVTMDQTMADVSALPVPPEPGDVAIVIGHSGDTRIGAGEVAGWAGTIPWEILTRLTARVPRRYLA
jgi:alanine racemase